MYNTNKWMNITAHLAATSAPLLAS